mmetsp:Transcript_21814/g.32348  ORF Transcript_21814/g.32348 Transcript_21814/m.32348 type:complete len:103 (+) Transcript_21814:309-617(+)
MLTQLPTEKVSFPLSCQIISNEVVHASPSTAASSNEDIITKKASRRFGVLLQRLCNVLKCCFDLLPVQQHHQWRHRSVKFLRCNISRAILIDEFKGLTAICF